jgi:hypothetical protein
MTTIDTIDLSNDHASNGTFNPEAHRKAVGLSDVNTTVHQYEYYRSTYRH